MRNLVASTAAIALMSGAAAAGGLDRSGQSVMSLYDDPGTFSFSVGKVIPQVTGVDTQTGTNYDVGVSYTQTAITFSDDINEDISFSLIYDQPFGAAINYNGAQNASQLGGTSADITTQAISALAKYQMTDRISFFGGLRLQEAGGDVSLGGLAQAKSFGALEGARSLGQWLGAQAVGGNATAASILASPAQKAALGPIILGNPTSDAGVSGVQTLINSITGGAAAITAGQTTAAGVSGATGSFVTGGGYKTSIDHSWGVGYTFGGAYEIPEIALRLAVTYHSSIEHSGATTESGVSAGSTRTETTFETPQSLNVEFQTGIAANTLLTSTFRWAEWGKFDVVPPKLDADLASISNSQRFTLGVARRFSDEFAGNVTLSFEAQDNKDNGSPLAPSDGLVGLTIGGQYEKDNFAISGGINYTLVGDADAGVLKQDVAKFTDNSVVGFGLKVSYEF